ncbi:Ig-like domain-containing protein [Microbacterium dauci]|uniref:Ig-like domain-containing protein n=1 Tax=Microbacterium dauci TaxID=3048008 RepID=A0ABT6ZAW5_9MICO|nr:Ig-like domain-containing protein [Microbacterium sp. LX3-4]MDJ1113303.1 Ig-like domain-containing protein [Microbacterium sp. LX3-4]
MARTEGIRTRVRPSTWIGAGAVTATLALVATLAVVWPGYDAQQTPVDDPTVWALQTGTGSGYARVNLELNEVDTVKQVENGTQLAQTADRLFVYSDGGTQFSDVDLATPADLTADAEDVFASTPPGTVDIVSAGDSIVYRTEGGAVFGATLSSGGAAAQIDPYAGATAAEGEEAPRFVATSVSVDAAGIVFAYSATDGLVVRAEASTGRVLDQETAPITPVDAQLTSIGGRWVLYDVGTGDLAIEDREEVVQTTPGTGSLVQRAATTGDAAYIADTDGVTRVVLDGGEVDRVLDAGGLGVPAAPTPLDGRVHAAWLADGTAGGALWSSDAPDEVTPLDYGGADIGDAVDPTFVGNGSRLALNDRGSGWVWRVPDGALVPSSQEWELDPTSDVAQENDQRADRVLDPKPPVAVDDAFGVRAGSVVLLPVLLNDHDPNEDVLSIDPASFDGPDAAFGSATITGAEQQVAVTVAPDATGTATLRYRVTDGTSSAGLLSEVATVTLRVVPETENAEPEWCGVDGCLAPWPTLSVAPGGTVSADVLKGWVDPDGDPMYLSGVTVQPRVGTVTTSPEGELTYQHPDPQATDAMSVQLEVVVTDARGASATRPLTIDVTAAPELHAESFAVTGVVDEPLDVSMAPYVTGVSGRVSLSSLVTLDTTRSTATANPSALSMTFSATEPGSYLVQYGVRDDAGEVGATVRVTMRAAEDTTVSTPPLTAFVRPNEDATIDVAAAAANPAGVVLLLDDIRPESDPRASLGVDLVGQSLLRVSGSTDDGQPGLLGVVRYRLTDGAADAATTAEGALTVILLPAGTAQAPIAVDDLVTVRAGAQVDIPILENDHAPAGALLALDPSSIVNETGGGLAFASGRMLRYLAPDEAGTYALTYTVSPLGSPEVVDTARVTVTVVGGEENAAPLPRPLQGRVVAGQSVTVPLDTYAVDPDGDAVVLDAIVSQPRVGSASVSADGESIVYTSPERFSGQVRFSYQVRDALGATGVADVRVGVIATQSDPSPVTFSDYVQVQAGTDGTVIVRPADNDVDPFGSELELGDVVPNAPAGSDEYAALADRVASVEDGAVTLRAGDALGTFSYSYTVTNTTGDTAIGLLVLKVVRDPVPDHPAVRDTILTLENREDFPTGVDVLTDMVSWNAGDPSSLELRLWGDPEGIEADGWRISGDLPESALLVPFEVSGTAFDGTEVTTYGFLRVPGTADIRLTLRAGLDPMQVVENESVDLDLADAVVLPEGQTLVLGRGDVETGGARAEASCRVTSGTTIRYTAGRGAPWNDTCIVPARLAIQDEYTYLALVVQVEAETPQPSLRSASLAVRPGDTATYDLARMVQWAGREAWDALEYATAYRGDQFEVEASGATVTVTAKDAARPGREEPLTITLPSHPDAPAASLVVTVGPAPSALPRGGSTIQTCSQSGGSTSCVIDVIGTAGEVNPLPGTPLRVVGANGPDNCAGVSFARAGDTSVRATWASDAEGAARCVGTFTVEDAQGRQSSGDRDGQVVLDLRGLPANPTRLEWTAYSEDSVTLRVTSDAGSYPGVDSYRITTGGREVATCPASGICAPISAPVGEKRTYEAHAVNAVGTSRGSVRVEAWAYRPPAQPRTATFTPVPAGNGGGVATIVVSGLDATTGSVRLTGGAAGGSTQSASNGTATFTGYQIGANQPTALVATPLTQFDLPPIAGGSSEGRSLEFRAHGIGAPSITLEVTQNPDGSVVTARATVAPNGVGEAILVGFSLGGQNCSPSEQRTGGGGGTVTKEYRDLPLWERVTIRACAKTLNEGTQFGDGAPVSQEITPVGEIDAPDGDATYRIGSNADRFSDNGMFVHRWDDVRAPNLRGSGRFDVRYSVDDGETYTRDFASLFTLGVPPGRIIAALCNDSFGCGTPNAREVTADPAGPVYTARVRFPDSCRVGEAPRGSVEVTAAETDYTIRPVQTEDSLLSRTYTFSVQWEGALSALGTTSHSKTCALPPPEPEPTPDPTPTPDPEPTPEETTDAPVEP